MFGISGAELLVIILVAVLVIPAKHWGDVAKFLAQCVKFIRNIIWKITDASEHIKDQIELEKPIDDLIRTTTDDVLASFSSLRPKTSQKKSKSVKNPRNNAHSKGRSKK